MVTVSGNPNPTYPTNSTNPTNPTTKYRCEFVNLFCIYAQLRTFWHFTRYIGLIYVEAKDGKSSELAQCAITGPCLRMHHRSSA